MLEAADSTHTKRDLSIEDLIIRRLKKALSELNKSKGGTPQYLDLRQICAKYNLNNHGFKKAMESLGIEK